MLNLVLTYGIPPEFRGGIHLFIYNRHTPSGQSRVYRVTHFAYRWRALPRVRRHRASKPQGSSERVLSWQVTMDQFIFASLSHNRGTIERRTAALTKARKTKTKQKQNKRNARERQHDIRSEDTSSRHSWLIINYVWRANQHGHTCFGLSSPWFFPSRLGILLHAVVQS